MLLNLIAIMFGLFGLSSSAPSANEIYSNEEEVYFLKEEKKEAPPWVGVKFDIVKKQIVFVNKSGNDILTSNFSSNKIIYCGDFTQNESDKSCKFEFGQDKAGFKIIELARADGTKTVLRKARNAECWAAIPKKAAKENGETDWYFSGKFKIFDQGGMAKVGDEKASEMFFLKLRNVVWPTGNNKPSLVLYVFANQEDAKAISYSWADNKAQRVGINIRTMQASCTIE